jgi:predicted metal-dependent HD superfamily phosphohydrolase
VTTQAHLHKSWRTLMTPFEAPLDRCDQVFMELAGRYSSEARHYHTLNHIHAMLELLPEAAPALALAVWFHDVVYDTRAADNEERSAAPADKMLQMLSIPPTIRTETHRLILLTKRHEAAEDDRDGRQLLDADLAILGAAEEEYDRYAAAIRKEYEWVPVEDYRRGRKGVLENFLQRKWLYFTEAMREQREVRARENLQREIEALG